MENPEKLIRDLSGEELTTAIEQGRQQLDSLLIEIERNPDLSVQDDASEKAFAQLEALITLYRKRGEETRARIDQVRTADDTTPDEDRFTGPDSEIPAFMRREN